MWRARLAGELVARGISYYFSLNRPLISFPSTVSTVRVSLAGSGCVKAVRFADGGVVSLPVFQLTGERKILSDVSKVSVGDECSLPKTMLALAVLALQQVASPLFAT